MDTTRPAQPDHPRHSPQAPQVIPQPRPIPILKNVPDIDAASPVQSFMKLAHQYGPIYRLSFPSNDVVVVSSQELVEELCNEKRFTKNLKGPLEQLRALAGDGLFTAANDEPNWGKAHRILTPVFGPASIRGMFPQMLDIAEQMLVRWERFGDQTEIDVADQMTRLTLDTIALCAFGYRFNSFYQNEMHPFVGSMVRSLAESGLKGKRLPIQNCLMVATRKQYEQDIRLMHEIADSLVAERRVQDPRFEKRDLLGLMLSGKDPQTGETLSDENIRFQLVTFLVAGHETTSGLLSFAIYELLKNPRILERAKEEVDRVFGDGGTPRVEQLSRLVYIEQILKETLRLWPTAAAFGVAPHEDTLLGGRYLIHKVEKAIILLPSLHRDPKVWGPGGPGSPNSCAPETFDPDRFATETFRALPHHAWKPFGNGQRACIGRSFAMQEAILVLAMVLHRFELTEVDPTYRLKIKEALTLKPEGLVVRAARRSSGDHQVQKVVPSFSPKGRDHLSASGAFPDQNPGIPRDALPSNPGTISPLLVLYGSNSGSSEAFAQRIVSDARSFGITATIGTLDEYAGRLPTSGAVCLVTASYEGQPPNNARSFVEWLGALEPDTLKGVKYTVFGCGNQDWFRTYQAVPKLIDEKLARAGATRLLSRGEADARGDFMGDFDRWYSGFWTALGGKPGPAKQGEPGLPGSPSARADASLQIEFVAESRPTLLRQGELQTAEILVNRELVNFDAAETGAAQVRGRSKRHIEIRLPKGSPYLSGDYLAVLPANPRASVDRALRRFSLDRDSRVILRKAGDSPSFLPLGAPIGVGELLTGFVELAHPATRLQIEALAALTPCPPEKAELIRYTQPDIYKSEILEKRVSPLDLVEKFESCSVQFTEFLAMLPPMRTRQYSISSSPLADPTVCALTLAIVQAPAWSGRGAYRGVASTYLAESPPGSQVSVAIRPSNSAFHLPESTLQPVIFIAAGSGIAPFRGFIQERAILAQQGKKLGPALLFFGCDHPDVDFLYRDELQGWERAGVVQVRPAFSAAPERHADENGNTEIVYVQHRLWKDRAEIMELLQRDAKVYVCGDGRYMAPAVRETLVRIYREATGASVDRAEAWMVDLELTSSRYVTDVFG